MKKDGIIKLLTNRTALLLLLLAASLIVINFLAPGFISVTNLLGVTQFGAVILLLGIGQSIVMVSGGGGIDLSIGTIASLSGILFGILCVRAEMNPLFAALLVIAFGMLLGLFNGFLVSVLNLPAFIATLSTSYMYSSLSLYITGGIPISGFEKSFAWLGQKTTLLIPNQVLFVAAPILIITLYAVNHTKYGRHIYLTGSNANAAIFAGINVKRIRCINYILDGFLAAIASIVMCSWLMTARADAGSGYDLQTIAVAVLGGIDINGGAGKLSGVIIAVLITTIISTGIQYANLNGIWQLAVLGIILILSVSMNQVFIYHSKKVSKQKQKEIINNI